MPAARALKMNCDAAAHLKPRMALAANTFKWRVCSWPPNRRRPRTWPVAPRQRTRTLAVMTVISERGERLVGRRVARPDAAHQSHNKATLRSERGR